MKNYDFLHIDRICHTDPSDKKELVCLFFLISDYAEASSLIYCEGL